MCAVCAALQARRRVHMICNVKQIAPALTLLLVACSGVATVANGGGDAQDDGATPIVSASAADGAIATAPDATSGVDAGADADADVDADADADADADVSTPDGGGDASVDAPTEAAQEASTDASDDATPDTGPPDTGPPDTGPPPVCTAGQSRCFEYQYQSCNANAWEWQPGTQSCCHDSRFSVVGSTVVDSTTGLTWYRYGGRGYPSAMCPALIPGGRLPTSDELFAITIGPPVNNVEVCSPAVDQVAFQNVYAGDTWTSDGCVDLNRVMSSVTCDSQAGFLCVSP